MATAEKTAKSEEATEDKTPKCDNHPHRNAKTFSEGIAPVHWCDECAPAWLTADEDK